MFEQMNKQNAKEGKRFLWSFPDNFMYLEVNFTEGFDKEIAEYNLSDSANASVLEVRF